MFGNYDWISEDFFLLLNKLNEISLKSSTGCKKGPYTCPKRSVAWTEIQEFQEKVKRETDDKARRANARAKEMQDFVDELMEIDKRNPLYEPDFLLTVPERHSRVLVRSQWSQFDKQYLF